MVVDRSEAGTVRITVPVGAIQTTQATDIMGRVLPEFILMFLEKNRKYAKVGNALGSRGVFPDIHRKVMLLKDRIWDGSDAVGEPTREVAMDLLGHLLLMIHMMDMEADNGLIAAQAARRAIDLEIAQRRQHDRDDGPNYDEQDLGS